MANLHVLGWKPGGTYLYHTMRSSETGVWTPFHNVFDATGIVKDDDGRLIRFNSFSCSVDATSGDLHVCGIDDRDGLWHTIRKADPVGKWSPWGSVSRETKFTSGFSGTATAFSASQF